MPIYVEFSKPLDTYCEAMSLQFGVSPKSTGVMGGGASTRAQLNDVNLTKQRDSLSDKLWRASVSGTTFGAVWIEFYRTADSDYPYFTYTLTDVLISAFSSSGQSESVSLNYSTVKVTQ
jgi:type VI secretion system secreted protein Hcp